MNDNYMRVSLGIANRNKDENRKEMAKRIKNADAAALAVDKLKNAGLLDAAIEEAIEALQ